MSMTTDEKEWIEAAIDLCKSAKDKGITMVMVRRMDSEGEGDYMLTNATSADVIAALIAKDNEQSDT